jgi:regulation of enolase protein 1 (concanavalin A-like superfamily)
VSLKIKREKADVMIFARVDDAWMALRHVPGFQRDGAEEVFVGIMACSPLGDGIKVEFRELWLEQ